MPMDDLLQAVPKLISRIDSLEMDLKQTKLTMGNAIVKLVKKVKKLEGFLKRRNLVLTDSEDEEPEAQGRKSQNASLSQGSIDKRKEIQEKKETEDYCCWWVVNMLDKVNMVGIKLNTVIEHDSMLLACRSNKDWFLTKEEEDKAITLGCSQLALRIAEEKKVVKGLLGSELQGEDFQKRYGGSCESRKKLFVKKEPNAKRISPDPITADKLHGMNYFKESRGTWKITSAERNWSFERRIQIRLMQQEGLNTVLKLSINLVLDGNRPLYTSNFGAMFKSISRDDLLRLYRIVDELIWVDGLGISLEKGDSGNVLRIMFEEPLKPDQYGVK
ncbi:hypothetical protein Tco_0508603 [Tanacetum coccineum]